MSDFSDRPSFYSSSTFINVVLCHRWTSSSRGRTGCSTVTFKGSFVWSKTVFFFFFKSSLNQHSFQITCSKSFPTQTMINHKNTLYAFSISCPGNSRTLLSCCLLFSVDENHYYTVHTNVSISSILCLSWPTMCRIVMLKSFLRDGEI